MGKKWTKDQEEFLKFLIHAGQSIHEIKGDIYKKFKIKRSLSSIRNRFYKVRKDKQ